MTSNMVEFAPTLESLLDTVLVQEGGWKITNNPDDNDGGFTVGGVTAKNFNAKVRGGGRYTYAGIRAFWNNDPAAVKAICLDCYHEKFLAPLKLEELPVAIRGPLLSAAINIGEDTAVKILQGIVGAKQDGDIGPATIKKVLDYISGLFREHDLKQEFLKAWMKHYIDLVQENSIAWREYALHHSDKIPMQLRAVFLEGWYNRVEFWRDK